MPRRSVASSPLFLAALLATAACAARSAGFRSSDGASNRSLVGHWDGVLRIPGSPPSRLTITLDSADGAWRGTLAAPTAGRSEVAFASVARSRDSVVMRLPSGQGAVFVAVLSPTGTRLDGTVSAVDGATFSTARPGSSDAAILLAESAAADSSRRVAAAMVDSSKATPRTDPDSAKLITSDIPLFWHALDVAGAGNLTAVLQREYLDRASVGVHDFIPGRILSAADLAAYVTAHRARYDSVRAANMDVSRAESDIRAAFHQLKVLYPAAVFPDVYFVIGRFNSGGTSTDHGLLIGAEMYRDPARLPAIVSHELIHYQQHYPAPTLLEHSFMEGTADFVGEMIAGAQINNAAHEYGLAHEHQLWQEFLPHADDRTFFPWMYGRPTDGRPNDLGYFIGYRIAKAYYDKATDKTQAIADIITARGGKVKELLAASGYAP
jgi:hypothetical protein